MNDLERFLACMEYAPADRRPNHELGLWPQTSERWLAEAPAETAALGRDWDWFTEEPLFGLDRRDYVPVRYGFIPPYEHQVLERTETCEVIRDTIGITRRALLAGTVRGVRMSMDQYLAFPVTDRASFADVRARLVAGIPDRYPFDIDDWAARAAARTNPFVLGHNCAACGFYWRAREWMGTEALSYAWFDDPDLMHEMMEFYADFTIETSRPVLERMDVDYFVLNEDLAMKGGPLLGPATFREFIFPHLCRLIAFLKGHGVRYVAVDSDGDPTALIPLFLDAGVDVMWPIERASDVSPQAWRRRFGPALRLWGGVDKRVLPRGREAIRAHLAEFIPLIEEGGFIPTIDHTVPPDISWDAFRTYMDLKRDLLAGNFARLT